MFDFLYFRICFKKSLNLDNCWVKWLSYRIQVSLFTVCVSAKCKTYSKINQIDLPNIKINNLNLNKYVNFAYPSSEKQYIIEYPFWHMAAQHPNELVKPTQLDEITKLPSPPLKIFKIIYTIDNFIKILMKIILLVNPFVIY